MDDLIISIPFYNEKKNLVKTLDQVKNEKNLLLIDDGSTDGYSLDEKYKKKLIKHRQNMGYGKAVKSASLYARQNNYKYFVIFPGDNQRDFKDVKKLYEQIVSDQNIAYVVGSKFHLLPTVPFRRKIGNLLFSKISRLWGNKNQDVLSGFKIYNNEKCFEVINKCPDDYSFDLAFNFLSNKKSLLSKELYTFCNYKNQTSKIKNLFYTFLVMIYGLLRTSLK